MVVVGLLKLVLRRRNQSFPEYATRMYDSPWLGGWIRFCILIPPNALRVGVSFMVTDVQVFCGYKCLVRAILITFSSTSSGLRLKRLQPLLAGILQKVTTVPSPRLGPLIRAVF